MKLSISDENIENPLTTTKKRFYLSESVDKLGIAYETEFNHIRDDGVICNKIVTIVFDKNNINQAEVKKILPN